MSSSTQDRAAPVSSPRLRLLARIIFGLTILGIAAGIWFSVLDAGGFETDLAFLLSFRLFPIIGYILAIRRPDNAISWLMLGIGAAFGLSAFVGSRDTEVTSNVHQPHVMAHCWMTLRQVDCPPGPPSRVRFYAAAEAPPT